MNPAAAVGVRCALQLRGAGPRHRPRRPARCPYAGPHPNPAKAADGKRLHALAIDQPAGVVVQRIFAPFLAGAGIFAIAQELTRHPVPVRSRPGL
ncbi:MAG: hypothetical protein ABSB01_25855 [Streptosporangiaceae bacterium]